MARARKSPAAGTEPVAASETEMSTADQNTETSPNADSQAGDAGGQELAPAMEPMGAGAPTQFVPDPAPPPAAPDNMPLVMPAPASVAGPPPVMVIRVTSRMTHAAVEPLSRKTIAPGKTTVIQPVSVMQRSQIVRNLQAISRLNGNRLEIGHG